MAERVAADSAEDRRKHAGAVVGGVEYSVGGWGSYEISRRQARWAATATGGAAAAGAAAQSRYAGRTYIHAEDAVRSVVEAGKGAKVLRRAATALAAALRLKEEAMVAAMATSPGGLVIPPLTSAEVQDFADRADASVDPECLYEIGVGVADVLGDPAPATPASLPTLPSRTVYVSNDAAVLRLEAAVEPYVSALELMQAALANQMEKAARHAIVGGSERRARATSGAPRGEKGTRGEEGVTRGEEGVTRGEEVDAAAATPPLSVIRTGLPFDNVAHSFDLIRGEVVVARGYEGAFYGAAMRGDPGRSTLLTPQNVARAAFDTSGRVYAWVVLDSAEACYAIRSEPVAGSVVQIDPDSVVEWLRAHMTGDPPHKASLVEYVSFLRSKGLIVHAVPRSDEDVVRFSLEDYTVEAERARELGRLRALTAEEFAEFDWSRYDRAAAAEACRSDKEASGDVAVDLEARTVSAPKVRHGLPWAASPHFRSYITFHTHPAARFSGAYGEAPSGADVVLTLHSCARDRMAWHFVSAPEGTYAMRPSAALSDAFLRSPEATEESVKKIYDRPCHGTANLCAAQAVAALSDAGFVAFFRPSPCLPLRDRPDLMPILNGRSRARAHADLEALSEMSAAEVAGLDWGPLTGNLDVPTIRSASWALVGLEGGAVVWSGSAHWMANVHDVRSYPLGVPGPVFAVYFPEEGEFPGRIPRAALLAAQRNSETWAWIVFLSPTRVLAFRQQADGTESFGPAARAAQTPN
jgi:hypothetical protein